MNVSPNQAGTVAGVSRGVRWPTVPGGGLPRWLRRLSPAVLTCLCLAGGLLLAQMALAAPVTPPSQVQLAAGAASAARPVDRLAAISCPTGRMCVAVGTMGSGPKMLAEKWNGRRWATMRLAQPTGATGAGLTGVSCTSARACTAVGYDNGPNLGGTLAEHWNGSKWSIQPTPSPGIGGIPFAAVSCGSATSCTAVGYYDFDDPGFASNTLAEHWNGHSWSSQSLPPVGNPGADLTSISCRPSACTAAGYYLGQSDEGPGTAPLAMRRNGTTWAVQATPGDAILNETSALTGVSCVSARACTAVGISDSGGPLIPHWNGATWRSQAVAGNDALNYSLHAVSCTSATACIAIGSSAAARWNGRKWASQRIRRPSGAHGLSLSAVSCSSASRCTAVGFKNMTVSLVTDILTVAERWNGRTWAPQATRNP
jgi:hypothetical protein